MKSDERAVGAATTLPDYLAPGLRIISVGLNPSPNSVRCGYPYATPQNRFWRAFNQSLLVARDYPPGIESMHRLRDEAGIGFTDVVKRPTPGAADLRARDFREWAPVTREKLERCKPRIVWFQGKMTFRNFVRYSGDAALETIDWGLQPMRLAGAEVFVTPNPSAANAAYSFDEIVRFMNELAALSHTLDPQVR